MASIFHLQLEWRGPLLDGVQATGAHGHKAQGGTWWAGTREDLVFGPSRQSRSGHEHHTPDCKSQTGDRAEIAAVGQLTESKVHCVKCKGHVIALPERGQDRMGEQRWRRCRRRPMTSYMFRSTDKTLQVCLSRLQQAWPTPEDRDHAVSESAQCRQRTSGATCVHALARMLQSWLAYTGSSGWAVRDRLLLGRSDSGVDPSC